MPGVSSGLGIPAAQILPCPSNFCKFQHVMDFGCPGLSVGWGCSV